MNVLAELERLADRMEAREEIPPWGLSLQPVGFDLVLSPDGTAVLADLREEHRTPRGAVRRTAPRVQVPGPAQHTNAPSPFFLWDNAAYVLGLVTEGKDPEFIARCHESFRALHRHMLDGVDDDGARALLAFLGAWRPEPDAIAALAGDIDLGDLAAAWIALRLEGDAVRLHERASLAPLVVEWFEARNPDQGICLATGRSGAVARTHPKLKRLPGGQSSGSALVSFNADAFTHHGWAQGANAPISTRVAVRAAEAANALLAGWPVQRVDIGGTAVVFWAQAPGEEEALRAESFVRSLFDHDADRDEPRDADEAERVGERLRALAAGRPLADDAPALDDPDTRIFVLGLAGNAGRAVVRFAHEGTLGAMASNARAHFDDIALDPPAWRTPPAARALAYAVQPLERTAAGARRKDPPAPLADAVLRAVLEGTPYPRGLLAGALARMTHDTDTQGRTWAQRLKFRNAVDARPVAIARAVIARAHRLGLTTEGVPMALDESETSKAYRLGRLLAVCVHAQYRALRDKDPSGGIETMVHSASRTPGMVFPAVLRASTRHVRMIRRLGAEARREGEEEEASLRFGSAAWFERLIGELVPKTFPRTLDQDDQGRFMAGYYHQRSWRRPRDPEDGDAGVPHEEETGNDDKA